MCTALRMKVEEVERVILSLLAIERGDRCGTDLEFQHQYRVPGQQDDIDPPSQAKQRIFEGHTPCARAISQCRPQPNELLAPCVKLRVAIEVVRFDEARGEALHDRLRLACQ